MPSLNLHYTLLPGCHQPPYQLPLGETYAPFLPHSSVISSSHPSPTYFLSLDVNAATDTLCSTLTSCLDNICPLSSRPARTAPSNPWLSDVLREHRTRLRAAERKWQKSKVCINRCFHLFPQKSTLPNRHISITRSTVLQICVISSEHLIISSVPLHHLPPLL